MKPVILEFEPKPRGDGTYELGTVLAGLEVWSTHFGFVNGKPVVTIIGDQKDLPVSFSVGVVSKP